MSRSPEQLAMEAANLFGRLAEISQDRPDILAPVAEIMRRLDAFVLDGTESGLYEALDIGYELMNIIMQEEEEEEGAG